MTTDRISGAFLFLLAVYVAWEARVLPLGTHDNPGPAYIPLLLVAVLGITGLILLFFGGRAPALGSVSWGGAGHAAAILGCCLLATVGMEYLGYRLTMAAILVFLFGVVERIKAWQTIGFGLGFPLVSFWVFDTLLNVILPRGELGF